MLHAMTTASCISLQLARYDQLRAAGPADPGERSGLLFCEVGADCRAAGAAPASREAFTLLVVGLHNGEESAVSLVEDGTAVAPWFANAAERWSGVLAPFRTKGESNLIHPRRRPPVRCARRRARAWGAGGRVHRRGLNRDGLDTARVQDFGTGWLR